MTRAILGQEFVDKLFELGVINTDDLITRVVIDAPYDGAVKIYVERFGDERLIDLVPAMAGLTVIEHRHKEIEDDQAQSET